MVGGIPTVKNQKASVKRGAYNELLNCFERVGIELRPEIDAYFSKFKTR